MNDVIPEPMQNILDIAAIIDEVVDMFVGEPICKSEYNHQVEPRAVIL